MNCFHCKSIVLLFLVSVSFLKSQCKEIYRYTFSMLKCWSFVSFYMDFIHQNIFQFLRPTPLQIFLHSVEQRTLIFPVVDFETGNILILVGWR